jgi:hypothetical protein
MVIEGAGVSFVDCSVMRVGGRVLYMLCDTRSIYLKCIAPVGTNQWVQQPFISTVESIRGSQPCRVRVNILKTRAKHTYSHIYDLTYT